MRPVRSVSSASLCLLPVCRRSCNTRFSIRHNIGDFQLHWSCPLLLRSWRCWAQTRCPLLLRSWRCRTQTRNRHPCLSPLRRSRCCPLLLLNMLQWRRGRRRCDGSARDVLAILASTFLGVLRSAFPRCVYLHLQGRGSGTKGGPTGPAVPIKTLKMSTALTCPLFAKVWRLFFTFSLPHMATVMAGEPFQGFLGNPRRQWCTT